MLDRSGEAYYSAVRCEGGSMIGADIFTDKDSGFNEEYEQEQAQSTQEQGTGDEI